MGILKTIFREKNISRINYDEFWTWFQKQSSVFFQVVSEHRNIEKEFFDKLAPKLNQLKEGIFYLTGMMDESTAELIFTSDGQIENFVFIEDLVKTAPVIKGWKFTAHKPALSISDVNIEMGGYKFTRENIYFYPNDSAEFPDQIDITVVHDDWNQRNHQAIANGTYIFLDNFLGELNFATTIDSIRIAGRDDTQKELIPIAKLKDYLIWRQKEFIEKYDGVSHNTADDKFAGFEAKLENGNALLAVMNTNLLEWENKASHPWILNIEIPYQGQKTSGMPDEVTYQLMDDIESEISDDLRDIDGYLNVGRQTAESVREVYFACKDFRKPSKILYKIQQKYSAKIRVNYTIYKDKYWQTFSRFL